MNEQDELRDEYEAQYGDPRRCPTHGMVTSSPDGMFDAPCPACEGESEDAAYEREREADLEDREHSPENEFASWEFGLSVAPDDDLPF